MLSLRHHIDLDLARNISQHNPPNPSLSTYNFSQTSNPTTDSAHTHLWESDRPRQDLASANIPRSPPAAGPYMSSIYDYSGPAIRVQRSTPVPQAQAGYAQEQGFPTHTSNWLYGAEDQQPTTPSSALQASGFGSRSRGHQRATSSSSAGSNSPASSFGHAASAMYSGQSPSLSKADPSAYNRAADEASRMYPNHLPTPNQTPTQDTFLASTPSSYSQFANLDSTMATHMAMKQAFADDDDAPGFSHSTRHSVSSFGRNSPATPRTVSGDDFEEGFRMPSTDLAVRPVQAQVPKLDRTLTDVYSDELFNPTSVPSSTPKKNYQTLLSPYHNVMINERLQQANQARSQSPNANGSRGVSPFRQGSPYAHALNTFASPQGRLSAGAQLRQKQKSEAEAAALSRQNMSDQGSEPKTISPKDAVLDYHDADDDAAKMPLFSDADSTQFGAYAGNFAQSMPSKADNSYGSLAAAGGAVNGWANPTGVNAAASYSAASTSTPSQAQFTFAPSSVPGMFHGLPTTTYASTSMVAPSEENPEFPAHLTSMESSASEAPPQSSQNSNGAAPLRPTSTLADTGTYTCTYHGCTQRFETPQKLQRHKREAHRQSNTTAPAVQSSPPAPGIGSGMTSAALAARNSQAGPHKCERINPTTGKPCNTIFSRPYDLTRHEDTIHNVRKQKVRCALCQEEKTFSRNDALTRHMRVVHPDVDFPGKHRKRGGHSDD